MAKSLQEQLMGAGLVDNKKAKAIKQQKRKQQKQNKQNVASTDPQAERLAAEKKAKQERDRELNQQIQAAAKEREIAAQITQLIQQHRLDRRQGEEPYQFKDGTKVRKLFVLPEQHAHLSKGRLAIAKTGADLGEFELVPKAIAQKIAERDAQRIIFIESEQPEQVDADDPYADYPIPDDLMW